MHLVINILLLNYGVCHGKRVVALVLVPPLVRILSQVLLQLILKFAIALPWILDELIMSRVFGCYPEQFFNRVCTAAPVLINAFQLK